MLVLKLSRDDPISIIRNNEELVRIHLGNSVEKNGLHIAFEAKEYIVIARKSVLRNPDKIKKL